MLSFVCHWSSIIACVHTPLRHAADGRAAAHWIGLRDMTLNHIRNHVRNHAGVWLQKMKTYLTICCVEVHGSLLHKQSGDTHAHNAYFLAKFSACLIMYTFAKFSACLIVSTGQCTRVQVTFSLVAAGSAALSCLT